MQVNIAHLKLRISIKILIIFFQTLEPPTVGGSAKGQWLTSEVLSMFLFHEMRALSKGKKICLKIIEPVHV